MNFKKCSLISSQFTNHHIPSSRPAVALRYLRSIKGGWDRQRRQMKNKVRNRYEEGRGKCRECKTHSSFVAINTITEIEFLKIYDKI